MPDSPKSDKTEPASSFWTELKRRKVIRVAITYGIVAWLLIQVSATVFPQFDNPDWGARFVTLLLVIGFPVAIILAWAFELTPDGIKTTKNARENPSDIPVSKKQQRKRNWMAVGFAAGLPTLIFGSLAVYFYATRDAPSTYELDKSIAVLPLENMSPDPDNAFFADGVQEDILTNLSKIAELDKVISRSSTLKFRDPDRNMRAVGTELGVRYVVEGSVRRSGDQVRVTVQLIDCESDNHVWAETYNRELTDIFAIQAEVARVIAGELKAAISPVEIAAIEHIPTQNQKAYDNYVQGRAMGWGGRGEEGILFLEKAVSLDPDFAEAWAEMGSSLIWRWRTFAGGNDDELLDKARIAYKEAVRSGAGLVEVLFMQNVFAFKEQNDISTSIEYLTAALALEPNSGHLRSDFGWRYLQLGRPAEALHYYEEAFRTDPLGIEPEQYRRFISMYKAMNLWEKAEAVIRYNIKHFDRDYYWRQSLAVLKFHQNGDKDALVREISKIEEFQDNPVTRAWLALVDRDYQNALKYNLEIEKRFSLQPFYYYGDRLGVMMLHPLETVDALLWFELGNEETSREVAKSAKPHLKDAIENAHSVHPRVWSNLSIVHALEGDRAQMELAASNARKLTETDYYQFLEQAECEMHIAICYLVLGDHDKAIETLKAASKMDSIIFLARELWFIFDRLRGNPRFDKLLEN